MRYIFGLLNLSPVNSKKVFDVKWLLELHFGSDWQPSLKFYVDFFAFCEGRGIENAELSVSENLEEICDPTLLFIINLKHCKKKLFCA